jgi:hypothetical protein
MIRTVVNLPAHCSAAVVFLFDLPHPSDFFWYQKQKKCTFREFECKQKVGLNLQTVQKAQFQKPAKCWQQIQNNFII